MKHPRTTRVPPKNFTSRNNAEAPVAELLGIGNKALPRKFRRAVGGRKNKGAKLIEFLGRLGGAGGGPTTD